MTALKTNEIDAFCARPPERVAMVLIFGPDDGLVSERGRALVKAVTGGIDDPFSLVRMTGADLVGNPARLADEALTVSMFGGRRVVWLRDAEPASTLKAVEPLLDHPDTKSLIVIEAGDLKKNTGLRKRFEDDRHAIAIPCYADSPEDLRRLIDQDCKAAGLTIEPDARDTLESLLGGDRMASRGEITKLLLYARGQKQITTDDVLAIVGDASALAMDEMVDAVGSGDLATADLIEAKLAAAGTHVSVAVGALIRHFQFLQRLRLDVDAGNQPLEVVERSRPPVFFRRKAMLARQLEIWPLSRIERAMTILDEAMLQSRIKPALANAIVSDAILQITRAARLSAQR